MKHTSAGSLRTVPIVLLAAALLAGCGGDRMAARIETQLGETLSTTRVPTALYDLDELNTLTLVLYGDAEDRQPGRYWYVLLVADLAEDGTSVNSIRECAYLAGSDAGAALYAADDVQVELEIENRLLRRRLRGRIVGRLAYVADLAEAPDQKVALLKATFAARADSLDTFKVVEQHADLIKRLRRRQVQFGRR